MTTIWVTGTKGSPGATTTAFVLAGCIPDSVLVDGDVDGGVLAVRHGLAREPGLTTLAADRSENLRPGEVLDRHAQRVGEVQVLVGPDHPASAASLWARAETIFGSRFGHTDRTVIIDGGRHRSTDARRRSLAVDVTLLVARSDDEGLVAAANLPGDIEAALVVIDTGPHSPHDLGEAADLPIAGVLPQDHRTAEVIKGSRVAWSTRSVGRSPLGRATRALADTLAARNRVVEPVQ